MNKMLTRVYPYLLLTFLLIACSKDKVRCYECDLQKNGTYTEAGCFTKSEWKGVVITDISGNGNLDKNRYCRTK